MRFLRLQKNDTVPDEKTIWYFREKLSKKGKIEVLFEKFRLFLTEKGVIAQSETEVMEQERRERGDQGRVINVN